MELARIPLAAAVLLLALTLALRPRAAHDEAPALALTAPGDDLSMASRSVAEEAMTDTGMRTHREIVFASRKLEELRRERDRLRAKMRERDTYICRLPRVRISQACLDNPLGKDCF